jgi:transposase InsO family protein
VAYLGDGETVDALPRRGARRLAGVGGERARRRLGRRAVAMCTALSGELGALHRDERHGLERSRLVVLCESTQVFDT